MRTFSILHVVWVLTLAGCANMNSVFRPLDTTQGQGALIDIKQRAILASKLVHSEGDKSAVPVVCAEPSPDALSAYAFDLAAQGNLAAGKALGLTVGSGESAAFVGLRTQSIQLLRDQFFRACEAYMNRAISAAEYNLLIRRYQKQTAALLAIEQLTGALVAPAAVVNASGMARGSTAGFLQNVFAENREKIAELEKQTATTGATDDQKKAAQAEIDRLKKQNDQIIESMKTVAQLGSETKASGDVKGADAGTADATARANAATVAQTVQHIVDNITLTDDFLQLCVVKFGTSEPRQDGAPAPNASAAGVASGAAAAMPAANKRTTVADEPVPGDMREACMIRMGIANESTRIANRAASMYLDNVLNDEKLTPAQKRDAITNAILASDGVAVRRADSGAATRNEVNATNPVTFATHQSAAREPRIIRDNAVGKGKKPPCDASKGGRCK